MSADGLTVIVCSPVASHVSSDIIVGVEFRDAMVMDPHRRPSAEGSAIAGRTAATAMTEPIPIAIMDAIARIRRM
jgi:hypothetical protein